MDIAYRLERDIALSSYETFIGGGRADEVIGQIRYACRGGRAEDWQREGYLQTYSTRRRRDDLNEPCGSATSSANS